MENMIISLGVNQRIALHPWLLKKFNERTNDILIQKDVENNFLLAMEILTFFEKNVLTEVEINIPNFEERMLATKEQRDWDLEREYSDRDFYEPFYSNEFLRKFDRILIDGEDKHLFNDEEVEALQKDMLVAWIDPYNEFFTLMKINGIVYSVGFACFDFGNAMTFKSEELKNGGYVN